MMRTTHPYLMTSGDILRTLGLSRKVLNEWKRKGAIRPASGGDGTGSPGFYRISDVLAISIGLTLRGRGFTVTQIGRVINWLLARRLETLKADWSAGRRLLVVVGDRIIPVLLTHGQVYDNPEVDLPAIFKLGLPVAIVDVEEAYRLLLQRVTESRCEVHDESHVDRLVSQLMQNPNEGAAT